MYTDKKVYFNLIILFIAAIAFGQTKDNEIETFLDNLDTSEFREPSWWQKTT